MNRIEKGVVRESGRKFARIRYTSEFINFFSLSINETKSAFISLLIKENGWEIGL